MYNVLYGCKSIIVDNETAAQLVDQANDAKSLNNNELASKLIKLAVKVEQGLMTAAEALNLANPVAEAA